MIMKLFYCAAFACLTTLCITLSGCDGNADGQHDLTPDAKPQRLRPTIVPQELGPLVAYRGATLIDGTGGPPIEKATVLVRGEKIIAVGRDIDVPSDVGVVDVQGKWIVPGLIDAHVHFMVSARLYTRPSFIDLRHILPYEEEVAWIQDRVPVTLRSLLCSGVTGALSAGGPSIEYDARAYARSVADAPTVFVAHGPITLVPEFFAKSFFPLFDGELTLKSARSAEEGVRLVREAATQEADLIKTVYDSGGSHVRAFMQRNYRAVHEGIVAEASDLNFPVTSHAHELEPARWLMELGVSSLQHIPIDADLDEAFIQLAKEREVIVVPTLALRERTFINVFDRQYEFLPIERTCGDPEVIESWFAVDDLPEVGDGRISGFVNTIERAYSGTRALFEAGVSVAVGTDAGNFGVLHGPSMHLELREMGRAGIPPGDLIVAATRNSARVAGVEDRYGTVEENKFADFLVLTANPLDDIGNLQAIDIVVKHGHAFTQDALLPPPARP